MSSVDKRLFYDFDSETKRKIGERQDFLCAGCGRTLGARNKSVLGAFHHVFPVASGNPSNRNDDWIKSQDNGVLLCDESTTEDRSEGDFCHYEIAHGGGRYRGFMAGPEAFPFSHGNSRKDHLAWVKAMNQKTPSGWATARDAKR